MKSGGAVPQRPDEGRFSMLPTALLIEELERGEVGNVDESLRQQLMAAFQRLEEYGQEIAVLKALNTEDRRAIQELQRESREQSEMLHGMRADVTVIRSDIRTLVDRLREESNPPARENSPVGMAGEWTKIALAVLGLASAIIWAATAILKGTPDAPPTP